MIDLNDELWIEFKVGSIFSVRRGKRLTSVNQIPGNIPYVSSSSINNGVTGFIKAPERTFRASKNFIGVNNSGSVSQAFFHSYNAVISDHVTSLSNDRLTEGNGLFICTVLSQSLSGKYSFNHEITDSKLANETILLPSKDNVQPDWQFMETFIEDKLQKYKMPSLKYSKAHTHNLSKVDWLPFEMNELFSIVRGNSGPKNKLLRGNVPLISARKIYNGFDSMVGVPEDAVVPNEVLTINNNGDGGAGISYYQPFSFTATQDVTILKPKERLSRYKLLFLRTVINMQQSKFGFGNKANATHLRRQKIMLPVTSNNDPDWQFMEDYIKSLPNSDLL